MDMGIEYKELVKKAEAYLKELVPTASDILFEEFGNSLPVENPPSAIVVVLSYRDSNSSGSIPSLFSKKMKSIYLSQSGELLAIKNRLA